jgi:hypothetical protein
LAAGASLYFNINPIANTPYYTISCITFDGGYNEVVTYVSSSDYNNLGASSNKNWWDFIYLSTNQYAIKNIASGTYLAAQNTMYGPYINYVSSPSAWGVAFSAPTAYVPPSAPCYISDTAGNYWAANGNPYTTSSGSAALYKITPVANTYPQVYTISSGGYYLVSKTNYRFTTSILGTQNYYLITPTDGNNTVFQISSAIMTAFNGYGWVYSMSTPYGPYLGDTNSVWGGWKFTVPPTTPPTAPPTIAPTIPPTAPPTQAPTAYPTSAGPRPPASTYLKDIGGGTGYFLSGNVYLNAGNALYHTITLISGTPYYTISCTTFDSGYNEVSVFVSGSDYNGVGASSTNNWWEFIYQQAGQYAIRNVATLRYLSARSTMYGPYINYVSSPSTWEVSFNPPSTYVPPPAAYIADSLGNYWNGNANPYTTGAPGVLYTITPVANTYPQMYTFSTGSTYLVSKTNYRFTTGIVGKQNYYLIIPNNGTFQIASPMMLAFNGYGYVYAMSTQYGYYLGDTKQVWGGWKLITPPTPAPTAAPTAPPTAPPTIAPTIAPTPAPVPPPSATYLQDISGGTNYFLSGNVYLAAGGSLYFTIAAVGNGYYTIACRTYDSSYNEITKWVGKSGAEYNTNGASDSNNWWDFKYNNNNQYSIRHVNTNLYLSARSTMYGPYINYVGSVAYWLTTTSAPSAYKPPTSARIGDGAGNYWNTGGNSYTTTSNTVVWTITPVANTYPQVYTFSNNGRYLCSKTNTRYTTSIVGAQNYYLITPSDSSNTKFQIASPIMTAFNGYGWVFLQSTQYGPYLGDTNTVWGNWVFS